MIMSPSTVVSGTAALRDESAESSAAGMLPESQITIGYRYALPDR